MLLKILLIIIAILVIVALCKYIFFGQSKEKYPKEETIDDFVKNHTPTNKKKAKRYEVKEEKTSRKSASMQDESMKELKGLSKEEIERMFKVKK